MRWILLIVTALISLISCSGNNNAVSKLPEIPANNVLPFAKTKTIEIISYADRGSWDKRKRDELIRNGKMDIDNSKIKERIKLTRTQKDSLYRVLYNGECPRVAIGECYHPRHAFIFYDSTNSAIAFLEVSFECSNYTMNGDYQLGIFCPFKLYDFTKSVGIKYFEEEKK